MSIVVALWVMSLLGGFHSVPRVEGWSCPDKCGCKRGSLVCKSVDMEILPLEYVFGFKRVFFLSSTFPLEKDICGVQDHPHKVISIAKKK